MTLTAQTTTGFATLTVADLDPGSKLILISSMLVRPVQMVSATATVGFSTGITPLVLPAYLKGILCFDMLAGRLEIVALLIVLYPVTWWGNRVKSL